MSFTKEEIDLCRTCDLICGAINTDCPLVHTWHKGTPTEEGIYVVAMDKYCPRISLYKWADGRWEGLPDPNIVMAWIKVPPYEEVAT